MIPFKMIYNMSTLRHPFLNERFEGGGGGGGGGDGTTFLSYFVKVYIYIYRVFQKKYTCLK